MLGSVSSGKTESLLSIRRPCCEWFSRPLSCLSQSLLQFTGDGTLKLVKKAKACQVLRSVLFVLYEAPLPLWLLHVARLQRRPLPDTLFFVTFLCFCWCCSSCRRVHAQHRYHPWTSSFLRMQPPNRPSQWSKIIFWGYPSN